MSATGTRSNVPTQKLSILLQTLGGPECSPEEIAWATDVPAGRALIGWIADQLPQEIEGSGIRNRVALQAMALSAEEAKDAIAVQQLGLIDSKRQADMLDKLANYDFPSALCSRVNFMAEEANFLEKETTLLKHRMKGAKLMSKQTMKTIETLRASIVLADTDIQRQQEQLGELSLEIDTSIAHSTKLANHLLDRLCLKPLTHKDVIAECQTRLSALAAARSEIVSSAERQLLAVDDAGRTLPSRGEVEHEAARLSRALRQFAQRNGDARKNDLSAMHDASYCSELSRICEQLEAPNEERSAQNLQRLLAQAEALDAEDAPDKYDPFTVDIVGEINRAWKLDQAALLASREEALDHIQDSFAAHLFPQLRILHEELRSHDAFINNADALINAFIGELEDAADDVADAQASSFTVMGAAANSEAYELLEAELVGLLKKSQNEHASENRLLVLLDRADLMKELNAISERLDASERAEEKWIAALPGQLSSLKRGPASHLPSHVYANSPVNTSPPFSTAPEQRVLEACTKKKADQLSETVIRLQKESTLSSRDRQKMDVFVEKW